MRKKFCCILGGAMYALFYALGWQMEHRKTCASLDTLKLFVMLTIVFSGILAVLLHVCNRESREEAESEKMFSVVRTFVVLLLFYFLMFVIVYPGILSYDASQQFIQGRSNNYSTHHPLLHTLMLTFFAQSRFIVGSFSRGVALYTLTQMVLMAFFFAQVCASVARFSGKKAAIATCFFFAIHPMHMIFTTIATKDVLFSGAFAWMLALTVEMISQERNARLNWQYAAIIFSGTLSCLMRNNMIYAVIAWLILMLIFGRNHMYTIIVLAISIVCLSVGCNQMLIWATNAEKGDMREMLSLPIQQVARVCDRASNRIEADEHLRIVEAFEAGIVWDDYEPTLSDPIKDKMLTTIVMENWINYAHLYAVLAKRCPDVYLDAAVELMLPFFYPYTRYDRARLFIESRTNHTTLDHAMWSGCLEENTRFTGLRNWMTEHLWNDGASDIPIIRWLFNTGLMVWIMLFFVLRELYAGRYRRFAVYMLPVLLWGTYLLGPIMNGRYAYVFLSMLPVLAAYPRQEKKEDTVILSEQIKGSVV